MGKNRTDVDVVQEESSWSMLERLARKGAREMIARALELEVEEFVEQHRGELDESGRRIVVRNGSMPAREIATGTGPLPIRQPRIDDRNLEGKRFASSILPRYMRRVPSLNNLIPVLYLKGVSTETSAKRWRRYWGRMHQDCRRRILSV